MMMMMMMMMMMIWWCPPDALRFSTVGWNGKQPIPRTNISWLGSLLVLVVRSRQTAYSWVHAMHHLYHNYSRRRRRVDATGRTRRSFPVDVRASVADAPRDDRPEIEMCGRLAPDSATDLPVATPMVACRRLLAAVRPLYAHNMVVAPILSFIAVDKLYRVGRPSWLCVRSIRGGPLKRKPLPNC